MTAIPEDVRERAAAKAEDWLSKPGRCGCEECADRLAALILSEREAAQREERERCAKVAKDWFAPDDIRAQYSHGSHYVAGLDDAADFIAAAILQEPKA